MRVPVTSEQATMVREALAQVEQATQRARLLVSVLSAGHVPDGSTLVQVEADALVFGGPDAA